MYYRLNWNIPYPIYIFDLVKKCNNCDILQ